MLRSDLVSFDGTRLAVFRGGTPGRTPVVFVNGLGGNIATWRPFTSALGAHFDLVCFDYRGLFGSGPSTRAGYDIDVHARDLGHVIDQLGLEKPVLIGWSMGVQVILEFMRDRPADVGAFVALNGTPGHPFRTAFGRDLDGLGRVIFDIMGRHWQKASWLKPVTRQRVVMDAFIEVVTTLGLASPGLDRQIFRDLGAEWVNLDLGVYSEIFQHLARHDAADILGTLDVPALLVGGGADRMTPAHRTELMASRMPGAELLIVPGGTHFSPVEFPDVIVPRVLDFLAANRPAVRLAA